jgi:A/G-specific adenine glycosylase
MLVVRNAAGEVLLERRPPAGIWGGLWSLPECDREQDASDWCRERFGILPRRVEKLPVRRHTFSHFHLDITPLGVELGSEVGAIADDEQSTWSDPRRPLAVGLAAPIARILREVTGDHRQHRGVFT